MKRFLLILIIFLFSCNISNAENITFLKDNYELQFAQKNSHNYINEYVIPSKNLYNWTNMITVHHLTKTNNEFDYLNDFIYTITHSKNMYVIKFFPEMNLLSFGIISPNDNESYIEYNVLRCESTKKGLKVLQFAHKYKFKNKEEFQTAYENSLKYNMKYSNALVNTQIPQIVKKQYEKK